MPKFRSVLRLTEPAALQRSFGRFRETQPELQESQSTKLNLKSGGDDGKTNSEADF